MQLSAIRPNPNNPRLIRDHKFRQLVDSIKTFPKMMSLRPIIIDDSYMILGGNQRFKALLDLGYDDVPDDWIRFASELTDDEKRRFIIEDNTEFGEYDWGILLNDYDDKELMAWGIDLPASDNIDAVNEQAEWQGMPEFIPGNEPFRIVISFKDEQTRQQYADEHGMNFSVKLKKSSHTWLMSYPPQKSHDLISLRYE
jgi:hypothetical protein